jgi:hypothetical protein
MAKREDCIAGIRARDRPERNRFGCTGGIAPNRAIVRCANPYVRCKPEEIRPKQRWPQNLVARWVPS